LDTDSASTILQSHRFGRVPLCHCEFVVELCTYQIMTGKPRRNLHAWTK